MTRAFEDHHIRRYVLGDLSTSEEGELEAALFSDAELLARVELARDDLADDYAASRLSAAERQQFEQRVLATDEGREQLAIARALQTAAAGAPEAAPRRTWHVERRWLALAAIVPIAVGAALVAWRLSSAPEQVIQRTDASPTTGASQPPATDSPPKAAAPVITLATLLLTADLERSGGLPPTLLLASSGATHVDLVAPRTGLQPGTVAARVESAEGKSVWSGPMNVPEADATDPRPRVRIPVSALPPGDFLLTIAPTPRTEPAGGLQFYFRVRAR
jgi:hypothetical protein